MRTLSSHILVLAVSVKNKNQMNRQILKQYIDDYKNNFDLINQKEIYKWEAVKCFKDNWNIDSNNFYGMLITSMSRTKNLLDSGQYFPLRMLNHYAESKPLEVKELFKKLFDEEEDLYERIQYFKKEINLINDELFEKRKSYQDPRAIIVYLVLRYPERYFFYKYEMFKQFSERIELIYRPIKGRIENIGHYNNLCELIRHELSNDQELLKLHKNRIGKDCYYDEDLNILTQDFIYAVTEYLNVKKTIVEPITDENTKTLISSNELSNTFEDANFKGKTVNFIQNGIENKRIGDLGELWVMRHEIEKLTKANKVNLIKKIKHISKNEGDGTGYDILSFDEKGNKIFIEVKTTKGKKNSTFFVTRNELERSKIEKDNYLIYRLYNFDEEKDTADLLIIKGNLTNLCDYPITFKVNLTNE